MKQGKAIIFSAPSGSGKTTIVQHLLKSHQDLGFSVSATTRERRSHEVHEKDYYFLSQEEFRQKVSEEAFIEWEQVYEGICYGTLKSEIERIWAAGRNVIFDVDVVGGLSLKKYFKDQALAIFVKVPSLDELTQRLQNRNTETEESLAKRLDKATSEMAYEKDFDVTLVNARLDDTLQEAEALVEAFIHDKQAQV